MGKSLCISRFASIFLIASLALGSSLPAFAASNRVEKKNPAGSRALADTGVIEQEEEQYPEYQVKKKKVPPAALIVAGAVAVGVVAVLVVASALKKPDIRGTWVFQIPNLRWYSIAFVLKGEKESGTIYDSKDKWSGRYSRNESEVSLDFWNGYLVLYGTLDSKSKMSGSYQIEDWNYPQNGSWSATKD